LGAKTASDILKESHLIATIIVLSIALLVMGFRYTKLRMEFKYLKLKTKDTEQEPPDLYPEE
jgi:hypothetical protein